MYSVKKITKRIIAWGACQRFEFSIQKHTLKIDYILDNNCKKWGTDFNNFPVKSPSILENEKINEIIIIIFTFSFAEIKEQLENIGLVYKKNFFHFLDFVEYRDLIDKVCKNSNDYIFLEKIIKTSYYCIDIGANCGLYSYKLSKLVGKEGKVFSIEPLKLSFEHLLKIKKLYFLHNIVPFNLAIIGSNKTKKVKIIIPRINNVIQSGLAHLYSNKSLNKKDILDPDDLKELIGSYASPEVLKKGDIQKVNSRTLDSLVDEIKPKRIDYIKCDVEGAEFFVLKGSKKTISRYKPLIQCELGWNYYESNSYKKVIDLLKIKGYCCYFVVNNKFITLKDYKLKKKEHNYYFIHKTHYDYYKNLIIKR